MSKDNFDYIAEANVTASNNFHGSRVPLYHFQGALNEAIKALEALDTIKKAIFYGRDLVGLPERHDVVVNCHQLPSRIDNENEKRGELLLHSIIGKATEAGEQLELLQSVLFGNVPFDEVNFVEEIGDGQWYDAIGLRAVGVTFDECQRRNIAKLRHRFPNAFTEYDANNRDLFGERKILEMQNPLAGAPRHPSQQMAEITNTAAAKGLHIEVRGPTGCGKTIAADMIKALIPNAVVAESLNLKAMLSFEEFDNEIRGLIDNSKDEVFKTRLNHAVNLARGLASVLIESYKTQELAAHAIVNGSIQRTAVMRVKQAIGLPLNEQPDQVHDRPCEAIFPCDRKGVAMTPNAQKQQCRIENWMQFGNVLIGDVIGHPKLGDAKGCCTSTVLRLDEKAGICETKNMVYTLGKKSSCDPIYED